MSEVFSVQNHRELFQMLQEHLSGSTEVQQRRARFIYALVSKDNRVALLNRGDASPNKPYTLPQCRKLRPQHLEPIVDMTRKEVRNIFSGGKSVPLNFGRTQLLGVAEMTGQDKPRFDIVVPVLGRISAPHESPLLESAPTLEQSGTHIEWMPLEDAINCMPAPSASMILSERFILHATMQRVMK